MEMAQLSVRVRERVRTDGVFWLILALYAALLAYTTTLFELDAFGTRLPFDAGVVARCIATLQNGVDPWLTVTQPQPCFYPPFGYEGPLLPWYWLNGPLFVWISTVGFGLWIRRIAGSWRATLPLICNSYFFYTTFFEGNPRLLVMLLGFALPGIPLLGPIGLGIAAAIKPSEVLLFGLFWLPFWWVRRRREIGIFVAAALGWSLLGIGITALRLGGFGFLASIGGAFSSRADQFACEPWAAGATLMNIPCVLWGWTPTLGFAAGCVAWMLLVWHNTRRFRNDAAVEDVRLSSNVWATLTAPLVTQPVIVSVIEMPWYRSWWGALYSWLVLIGCIALPVGLYVGSGQPIDANVADHIYIGAIAALLLLPYVLRWLWHRLQRRTNSQQQPIIET